MTFGRIFLINFLIMVLYSLVFIGGVMLADFYGFDVEGGGMGLDVLLMMFYVVHFAAIFGTGVAKAISSKKFSEVGKYLG